MDTEKICPNCRKALPPDVPLGLCPECLIKAGFPTESGVAGAAGERFVPPPVEDIARLFPQLEVLGLIGKGGMGAVYKARQPALDRFVALKVLPPALASGPGFAERFNREARALARLSHPNIVAVYDFGKAGDLHYVLMEFIDGANLREIERTGSLTPEQALAIVPQICEALQFAHNEGVVHRDIKPENLLLDKKGRLKITDFGIAKMVGLPAGALNLTSAGDVVGTPHYMAPEQIEKPLTVDHRADIYSLGVVFYEMLTGELPLGKFAPPSRKVEVDVRLDEVVLHALEKEPSRRYQQASDVKTDLESITRTPRPAAPAPAAPGAVPPVRPPEARPVSDKGLLPAFLLALFFGVFGAHRFYVGKTGSAVVQLFTFGGLGVWMLIDWILLLCKAFHDGQGRRIARWLPGEAARPEPAGVPAPRVTSEKALLPAFLLALFFGIFGAHRFYLGKPGTAVLQLFTFGGLGVWMMIDWVLLLCKAFKDGQGKRVTNWLHQDGSRAAGVPKPPRTPEEQAARARVMVIAPAVGLMVAAAWRLFWALNPPHAPLTAFVPGVLSLTGVVFFRIIPSCLVLVGAWQMARFRSYAWAIAGAILAVVFCGMAGFAAGIWALAVLSFPAPRELFGVGQRQPHE
jgi:TM2 domain-containing membrane protein YozV/predicted Ser/Thr protein kinase